jgi:acetylornithine deacetylase
MNLSSSSIPEHHELVGWDRFRSHYLRLSYPSDQSVLSCKSLGPGDTLRSHSADEFIYLNEIEEGFIVYKIVTDFFKAVQ